jgi:hypothetical protein
MPSRYAVAGLTLFVGLLAALPARPAPAAAPRPVHKADAPNDEIKALIDQLGADDYAKREAAAKRLRAIGKPAIPALEAATKHDDAEVASRAQALVKRIAVRPLPAPDPRGAGGLLRRTQMRIHVGDGNARVIDVTENGRQIQIREGPDGISMVVQGLVDGEPGSEEYTANNAEQLKEDNPDAFTIYRRWTGAAGGDMIFGGAAGRLAAGRIVLQRAPDEIDLLRGRIDKQMRDNKLREADRDEVNKAVEKLAGARANLVGQMDKYSDACDELRKTLDQYKLDAGELLPPPARTRLGVSLLAEDGQLQVQQVGGNSRGQRLGLKPGDVIRKVDGKDVADVGELRKLVGAKDKGLTLDVTRDGDDLKLTEKEPAREPAAAGAK